MSELLVGRPRDRYLRLRYEDFVRDPQAAVRQVAAPGAAHCASAGR